jgi:hypothetical protein
MNETETQTTTTVTETVAPTHPDRYARNDRASFAAGEETTPDQDAEARAEHGGSFAAGEETTPDKDAEERTHPGTFGDTGPTA